MEKEDILLKIIKQKWCVEDAKYLRISRNLLDKLNYVPFIGNENKKQTILGLEVVIINHIPNFIHVTNTLKLNRFFLEMFPKRMIES